MMNENERKIYSRARISKDKNFDGRFFFAVKTTGIFCRPSCSAPIAKEENVIYTDSFFQALELGFRPCHRCRPDLQFEYHNSYIPGSETVKRALKLIYDGFLNYHSLEELASEVCISPRQLRKLFTDCIGISPVKTARYHKTIFAKKMLLSTARPVTEIAFASGFRSTRQFNSTYKEILGESPSETKKRKTAAEAGTSLLLEYQPSFDFRQILSFMKPRLIAGVEKIEQDIYFRTFRTEHSKGWFSVGNSPDKAGLKLTISCDDIRCYMEIYYRVRKMFDLDTDLATVNLQLGNDPFLQQGMSGGQVPRLPAAFNPFEFVIRAILGQQITVKAATTLTGRLTAASGIDCTGAPDGLLYFFPGPEELSTVDISDIGITGIRQQTIRTVTEAVIDGRVQLSSGQRFSDFAAAFGALKGIGSWTVNYTAMRGLGMHDAFPAADLGIIKAMAENNSRMSAKEIEAAAEKWRPYRSYAALCIWNIPAYTNDKE